MDNIYATIDDISQALRTNNDNLINEKINNIIKRIDECLIKFKPHLIKYCQDKFYINLSTSKYVNIEDNEFNALNLNSDIDIKLLLKIINKKYNNKLNVSYNYYNTFYFDITTHNYYKFPYNNKIIDTYKPEYNNENTYLIDHIDKIAETEYLNDYIKYKNSWFGSKPHLRIPNTLIIKINLN